MALYDDAVEEMLMALELEPLSRIINANYGQFLSYVGRYEEGVAQLMKTSELDPAWAYPHWRLGVNYLDRDSYSEAIRHFERAATLEDSPYSLGYLGYAYAKVGRIEDANAVLERLDAMAKTRYVSPLERATVYAGLGEQDTVFELMEKALDERESEMPFLRVHSLFEDVKQDPRLADLLRRVGLEE